MASHHPQSAAPVVNLRDYRPPNWVPPLQGVNLGLQSRKSRWADLREEAEARSGAFRHERELRRQRLIDRIAAVIVVGFFVLAAYLCATHGWSW